MKWRFVLAFVIAVIMVGVVTVGALSWWYRAPHPGKPAAATAGTRDGVPVEAGATVRLLFSARGREALTPELNAVLPHGSERLFPAGSTFTATAASWHQAGSYANLTGTLREPGKAPAQAEIGFVSRRNRWLITFEATR